MVILSLLGWDWSTGSSWVLLSPPVRKNWAGGSGSLSSSLSPTSIELCDLGRVPSSLGHLWEGWSDAWPFGEGEL